jgi:hypothetical protein
VAHRPGQVGQLDALVVHKLDRLTRSLVDCIALPDWCKAHGKTVFSVSESLDFSSAWPDVAQLLVAKGGTGVLLPDPPVRRGWPDGTRTTRVGRAVIKVDYGTTGTAQTRSRGESK